MWTILENNYALELVLILTAPALLVTLTRRRWLWPAMAVWLVLPLAILIAALLREVVTRPVQATTGAEFGHALLVLGPPITLIWVFFSVIGFGIGFALRSLIGRSFVGRSFLGRSFGGRGVAAPSPTLPAAHPVWPNGTAQPASQGGLRVDYEPMEWGANGHWINNPRVTDVATGAILFDLWKTPADASARFPAPGLVQLEILNWYDRRPYLVTIDLGRRLYQIDGRSPGDTRHTEGPLADLDKAYERATFPTPVLPGQTPMQPPMQPGRPAPTVAWRSGGLILLAALGAIAAVAVIARNNQGQGIIVTPMTTVPRPVLPPQP